MSSKCHQSVIRAPSDRHASDLRFEHQLRSHHALHEGDEASRGRFDFAHDDDERVAGNYLSAKHGVIATQEAEEPERGKARAKEPARALRAGLDHEHAGVERATRDVMLAPEFVGAHIFGADAGAQVFAGPHDPVHLPHRAGLWKEGVETSAVADDLLQINS